jgi:hypothetical protein
MRTEKHQIKTDIKIGKEIFENIPDDIKPGWAGLVLSRFDNYVRGIPTSITELYSIIDNKDRWNEAHGQFNKIRYWSFDNKDFEPKSYLLLAEKVSKIIYNCSGQSAPFDSDSGFNIPSLALQTAGYFEDSRLEEEVKSTILLFKRNKKFKDDLNAAKDFSLYKKINDILWLDWDPIGINDMAPRDEYQGYVPQFLKLKKAGADRQQIAKRLLALETEKMGMSGTLENCLRIADKIIEAS